MNETIDQRMVGTGKTKRFVVRIVAAPTYFPRFWTLSFTTVYKFKKK